jgi:hypothetical protein
MLASARIPDDTLDLINQVGWFLPFVLLIVPMALIFALLFGKAVYVILAVVQVAGIAVGLRAIVAHLRRTRFNSYQVKLMLGPCYLVACFVTNIVELVGVGIVRKFF